MEKDILLKQAKVIAEDNENLISVLANLSSLLMNSINNLNWVGFYILKGNALILGPFQGEVACSRLPLGKGVCSKAVIDNKTINVSDVSKFSGHIACSKKSVSELVIPIRNDNKVVAVLDIDSPIMDRLDSELQELLEIIVKYIKWGSLC